MTGGKGWIDPESGLSDAQVQQRVQAGKVNRDASVPTKSIGRIIRDNACTLFNLINAVLAAAVLLVGSYKNLLFLGVVFCNLIIGTVQEIRAKRTVDKLSLLNSPTAEVIRGATNNGLYCYMKHFAVSEEGVNPDNVMTWLTEQTLRETYLRPFEIAVKEGGANAIMTAFNCIGAVWSAACDPMNNDILRGEWGFDGSLITDWAMGRDWMDGMLGIRGGNDIWLDSGEPFDSDATTVSLLQTATKNILYTFANTYYRAKDWQENGEQDDRYKVELKMEVTESPYSPVPVLMVVGIWALALAGSAVCVAFIIKKPGGKSKAA